MTITPTPANATRSLTVFRALRPKSASDEAPSPRILHRLALTLPGLIVMGGGLALLALAPEGNPIGIVTFLVGVLVVYGVVVMAPITITNRRRPDVLKSPTSAELDAEFNRSPSDAAEIIDTAAWLSADGLERSEAISWLLELHRPTGAQLQKALELHAQRMHRKPSDEATHTLFLLIAATAACPPGQAAKRWYP